MWGSVTVVDTPPAVPDGELGTLPLTVSKVDAPGSTLEISFDDSSCADALDTIIVAGNESDFPAAPGGAFEIQQGTGAPFADHSRSLYDYTTILSVYQGCANLAPSNDGAPFNTGGSEARCTSLFEKGLVSGATTDERAEHAQAIINAAGILPEPEAIAEAWMRHVDASLNTATLTKPESGYMHQGGKTGMHSEHLGYILAEMQFLQRAYPGATW